MQNMILIINNYFPSEDDTSSERSGMYSAINYSSGNELECDSSSNLSVESSINSARNNSKKNHGVDALLASNLQRQCSILQSPPPESSRLSGSRAGKKPVNDRRLMRNRSMVDLRSQLLHQTIVEQLKKKLCKTVGAVENIGFQMPYDGSSKSSSSSKKQGKKLWK